MNFILENYPWRNPIKETETMYVFKDGFPVTDTGHYLFVPKSNSADNISLCMASALEQGHRYIDSNGCDGFNIGLNTGAAAGQTVMWPHVHLILRRTGDCANPKGGIRNVIPGKGDYTKNDRVSS